MTPTLDTAAAWVASYPRTFTAADLQRELGVTLNYAVVLVKRLTDSGRIERVERGRYRRREAR